MPFPVTSTEELRQRGMLRIPALLKYAKGMPCQNCRADDGTVVAAHSNMQEHGRGKDNPAHDCFHAWLCVRCHSWLDHGSVGLDPTGLYEPTRAGKVEMFMRAMCRTWYELWRRNLVRVA